MTVELSGIERDVLEQLRALPPDRQRDVLDFAEFLRQKASGRAPRRSARGLWAGFDLDVSDEDIAEARREMWGNFPRELPLHDNE